MSDSSRVHRAAPALERRPHLGHGSRSPLTAASAAACDTLATFDVACDCRLAAALTTSGGPIIQPTRQPVMA